MFLRCNNQTCFTKLYKESYVTKCIHIFCYKCCHTILRTERCLTCDTALKRRDISETHQFETIDNIYGKNPLNMLDITTASIRFYLKNKEFEIHIYNQELNNLKRKYQDLLKEFKGLKDVHLIEKQLMEEKIFNLEREVKEKREKKMYEEIISTEIKLVNENHGNKNYQENTSSEL